MLADLPWDLILEILGFSVGVLYLWWEYHANSKLWFASIVMPTISMWIYLRKGIYADFAINIYYFLIAIYGYIVWTRKRNRHDEDVPKKEELPISHISKTRLVGCVAVFFALWIAFYCVLRFVTDSSVPVADSFTTALSIVAMWMLAQKYVEQWIAWIAVDAVCVGLYAYKGIYLYAVLYSVYTVIAFVGYRNWKRKMSV
ncbi:MAG: nicotinamide riboside transporter PnuC [Muribaculaceae bacterium]|nr:nicotinamide riboside transporter PnuC [Muribaculaceae bacterium]